LNVYKQGKGLRTSPTYTHNKVEVQFAKGVCQKETILTQYQKGFLLEIDLKNQQVA